VQALARGRGELTDAWAIAEGWKDTPQVALTLKAAMTAGSTSDADWAAPLVSYGLAAEFIELIRGVSVLGRLGPSMRRSPFRVKIPRELTGGTASWTGEGKPKPASAMSFDSLILESYKSIALVVLSEELVRSTSPAANGQITDVLARSVAAFLDAQFLDPTITMIAGERPASITNGGPSVVSSGASAAQILADLTAMTALLGSWMAPYWVMKPSTASAITGKGQEFTGLTANGGLLLGIPAVTSITSPQQITLLDAGDLLLADDGNARIEFARHATIEMDSAPTNPPTASTVFISLWQANLVGLLVERQIAWLKCHDASAVVMAVAY
jgi:HK97 family phage major capsid protein